jgi:hypothetical protein
LLRTLLLCIFFIGSHLGYAQLAYQLMGASAAGKGNATVAQADAWAMQYNVGALAGVQQLSVAAGIQTRFNLPELSTTALVLAVPTAVGVVGGSVSRYGLGPYHLTEASVGFAHKIRLVSIGVQGSFVQSATTGFGSTLVPVLSVGGTAELVPTLQLGAYVYNITQSSLKKEIGQYLPTLLRAGLQWQAANSLQLAIETEKDVDFPARFKAGVEYRVKPFLAVRTGLSTQPVNLHGGLGLRPGNFRFDYAMEHHAYIGLMHHVSFGWQISKSP